MAVRYDIALSNNDILFQNGDIVLAESDQQHVIDTINAFAGWWKEYPLDGVGLMAYTKSAGKAQEINQKIRIELTSDGYGVQSPLVTITPNGQMTINPNAVIL